MTRTVLARCLTAFAAAVAVVVVPTMAQAAPPRMPPGLADKDVCAPPVPGVARCHAKVETQAKNGQPYASTTYGAGFGPADLQAAYKLPAPAGASTAVGSGRTVAIVDAYDNPNTAADLAAYRQQFHLPLCPSAATTPTATDLTGCFFTKVNQAGAAAPLPTGNVSWGQEIDLDVEMVTATCPDCKILLVEANSASFADLGTAVDTAARLGATAISNSYGGSEFRAETGAAYNGHFNHPGIAITVSSGDSGYGTQFPAASQYVTAVGGTHLVASTTARGWTETAWSGAGSGCSSYIARPSWQPKTGNCNGRTVADVSAVADPATGVAVYDSYGSTAGNWYVFGGTSVASPIVASVYALAGNTNPVTPSYLYTHAGQLFDVLSGSNGRCSNTKLCTAVAGYDGPTGLGTPNGTGAF